MTIPFPILPLDYCVRRFTLARKFVALTKSQEPLNLALLEALFASLPPISPDTLVRGGEWRGIALNTGHPFQEQLTHLDWRGCTFHSVDDVVPIVVGRDENCEKSVGVTEFGGACLRKMEYRDIVSSAMIFDDVPAIMHLRFVNERMVAGVMESKEFGKMGKFYFYLVR